jgi:putative transposase
LVVRSDVISDELWVVIEPVLPSCGGRRGRPWNDHRLTLEAIAWRFRTGSPWRDLPVEFGAWQSVWERHRRWSVDGTYAQMFAAVRTATPDDGRRLVELIAVDSTSIRVHQHAAGGRFHGDLAAPGGGTESQESARRAS